MSDSGNEDRKSRAAEPELIGDPFERAKKEVENGLRQIDEVMALVDQYRDRPFKLRLSTILGLQRTALAGISGYAGLTRPRNIIISGSHHTPPGAHMVPSLLEEMCDYVNDNWAASTPLHLSAYAMWRLNWIHPFVDGNGRTSRAVSYLVLCMRLGYPLPGTHTIPEQIASDKGLYYGALEQADQNLEKTGKVDVAALEKLLEGYLSAQLVHIIEQASGNRLAGR
jgi:Fic family protein